MSSTYSKAAAEPSRWRRIQNGPARCALGLTPAQGAALNIQAISALQGDHRGVGIEDAADHFLSLPGSKLKRGADVSAIMPSVKPPLEKLSLDDLLHLERVVRALIEKRMLEEKAKGRQK